MYLKQILLAMTYNLIVEAFKKELHENFMIHLTKNSYKNYKNTFDSIHI